MHLVRLHRPNDFDEWQRHARGLIAAGIAPADIAWRYGDDEDELFDAGELLPAATGAVGTVPRLFIERAQLAIQHSDPVRFSLLYRLLWRQRYANHLLDDATDKDNSLLTRLVSGVRRDSHKMKAFVRFRKVVDGAGKARFLAWFEPEHFTLEATAPFFARRFAGMHWAIVTPYASAWWDTKNLHFGPGGRKSDIPAEDAVETDWNTYYRAIFNPARLKVSMMKSEMPVKYWRNLPEAANIAPLIRNAKAMEQDMIARAATQPPPRHLRRKPESDEDIEEIQSLADARAAVQGCRRCPLYEHATQAVFGEGPERADVMFVGEQPGDQEDLQGRPFVGPAGQVLDNVIEKVGIDRRRVYVTNAVKHFKFTPRGKRRIHQRPDGGEIQACKFWLGLEIGFVRPRVIVALGATAAQSLIGKASITISKLRGEPIQMPDGIVLFVTNHPSYLLRIPDAEGKRRERAKFEADLVLVRETMAELEKSAAPSGDA
jgi:uracil-DNA glycosylase, family 4